MMMNRREFVKTGSMVIGGLMLGKQAIAIKNTSLPPTQFHMPDESEEHSRTWMAFVANDYIWSNNQIPEVKRNLIQIAQKISKYEPVSMLVNPKDYQQAQKMLGNKNSYPFTIDLVKSNIDDLWLRDTGPTFVTNEQGEKIAINFNFNGWGNKQEHSYDKNIASFIAQYSQAISKRSIVVMEGGCFEIDGKGTAIMTKSCIINDNRNPKLSQEDIEQELKKVLGLKKIIWLEGIKGRDITDAHTDFYARFIKPGEIIVSRESYKNSYDYTVTRKNIEILSQSTDADDNLFKLTIIDTPTQINEKFGFKDFAAGYIGYYVCNGAVIAQKFGDLQADNKAKKELEKAFPNRVIEQISVDGIASGGGSIHCATQQEIKI